MLCLLMVKMASCSFSRLMIRLPARCVLSDRCEYDVTFSILAVSGPNELSLSVGVASVTCVMAKKHNKNFITRNFLFMALN